MTGRLELPEHRTDSAAADAVDGGSAHRRGRMLAATVAVAVLVAATAVSTLGWWRAQRTLDRLADVEQVAAAFVEALASWDATGGLDDTRDRLAALAGDPVKAQIEEFFAGPDVAQLVALQARSQGTVDALAVDVEGDTATAFAAVTMRLTNSASDQQTTLRQQVRLELRWVDGRWLVTAFETAGYVPTADVLPPEDTEGSP